MGQETRQVHRFPCMSCGEDMVVALNVDFQKIAHWVEAVENAEHAAREDEAPVINLDANFLIPEAERHVDNGANPRMTQLLAMAEIAEKQGSLRTVSLTDVLQGKYDHRPYRRPDYADEWRLLKKAWSLHRRGQDLLAQKKIASATELFYKNEPLDGLQDWLWRFVLFIGQPNYEAIFRAASEVLRPILRAPGFMEFADWSLEWRNFARSVTSSL